jgi:hypothetical protein
VGQAKRHIVKITCKIHKKKNNSTGKK